MSRRKGNNGKRNSGGRAGNVCCITGTALIVIVILLCAMLVVPGVFGFHMYNVISGSMEPALKVGSLIYIKEGNPEDVEDKDIIAYYSSQEDGGIITHRVVKNNVAAGSFRTKGDANDAEDPTLTPYENYIGSVALKLPYMGKVFTIMTSLYGKIAAACAVGLGAVLNMLGSRQKEESGEE